MIYLNRIFWTISCRLICYLKGVIIGKSVVFYGRSVFYKRGVSSIEIGNGCRFRSSIISNRIGINRRCLISCMGLNARITIGRNSGFSGVVIGSFSEIIIGNNIKCGANTLITDGDWHPEDARCPDPKPVYIEDNVWIGEGVKILKGVRIGINSVIGAGSVVTKDIPDNVIAAGNPCKVIRKLMVAN